MTDEPIKPFFFDVAELEGHTIEELFEDSDDAEEMYELFGKDLVTRMILLSPSLTVVHETGDPGERVKPHRHGTLQIDFVLAGELIFGSHRLGPGMGYVIPDTLYSWRVGDEGAEWLEIHAGIPGTFTDRPG